MSTKPYNQKEMPFSAVNKVADADFPTRWGHFRILGFEGIIDNPEACNDALPAPARRIEGAVALVMGDIHSAPPSFAFTPSASPETSSTLCAVIAASSSSSPSPPSPKRAPGSSSMSSRKAAESA